MPSKSTFRLETLVDAIRHRLEHSTVRAMVDEIGISRGGLESLLDGRTPRASTRTKLVAWYLGRQDNDAERTSQRDIDAAIDLLVQHAMRDRRPSTRAKRLGDIIKRIEARAAEN